MGQVKIAYYVVRERHGKRLGYWQPSAAMRAAGFLPIACGPDGPEAWQRASQANEAWQAYRRGAEKPRGPVWPSGSLGAAFNAYRLTNTWAAKAPRTREDWERGWRYIAPDFGDVAPSTVTLEIIDDWYHDVLNRAGVREAHRAMKIWRALWRIAAAEKLCDRHGDPSLAIRRKTPQSRSARWSHSEIVERIHLAWRIGYRGLAVALSIAWDTGFSPVDVRTLTAGEIDLDEGRFGAVTRARSKTGQAAAGYLSRRSRALLDAYRLGLGIAWTPAARLIRTRRGQPYGKNDLAKDFRAIRGDGETRRIMDIRRSVALETMAGGATDGQLAAKMANTIDANKDLQKTYLPVDLASVRAADQARRTARKQNDSGGKV